MFCSLLSGFYKDVIISSLKANDGLKFAQDVALNHVRAKVKTQYKISCKVSKEEDVYDSLFYISPYPTCIKLKYYLGGIHNCVIFVGKWMFYINSDFSPFSHKIKFGLLLHWR